MADIHAEEVVVGGIRLSVEQTSPRTWHVTNLEKGTEYDVSFRNGHLKCPCQGFIGHDHCHHVKAVTIVLSRRLNIGAEQRVGGD